MHNCITDYSHTSVVSDFRKHQFTFNINITAVGDSDQLVTWQEVNHQNSTQCKMLLSYDHFV